MIPIAKVSNLQNLKDHLSNLHFRRISNVRVDGNRVLFHCLFNDDENPVKYEHGQLPPEVMENKKYYEGHVESYASHFTCMTTKRPLRDNDRIATPIFASSQNMYDFNHITLDFDQKCIGSRLIPYNGALIAGVVNFDNKGRPFYERWGQVSDQFFRCVTLLLYGDSHPAIETLREIYPDGRIEHVYHALMRGNTLTVSNNIQKERIAREHSNVEPMTPLEFRRRYVRTHNEYINRSPSHIHWYNLIVLLCVYGEGPCELNIPNNIRGPRLNSWIVDEEDKAKLYEYLGVEIVGEKPMIQRI